MHLLRRGVGVGVGAAPGAVLGGRAMVDTNVNSTLDRGYLGYTTDISRSIYHGYISIDDISRSIFHGYLGEGESRGVWRWQTTRW